MLQSITAGTTWSEIPPPLGSGDWFALQTRSRFERKVCAQVENKNHEAFVPVTRVRHRWSDRNQTIEVPLFPGYVFVRAAANSSDRLAILQTSGVYGFVTFNGIVARIPDGQINDLRRIETQNCAWSAYPFLEVGQLVRIHGGCLDGLQGIFVADRGNKLVISVDPMQRSIALDVDSYDLEPV